MSLGCLIRNCLSGQEFCQKNELAIVILCTCLCELKLLHGWVK
jgi:hypothetical protein